MIGQCECCGRRVGRSLLVTDHCHDCGGTHLRSAPRSSHRGMICHDCNTALTVHAIAHWDAMTEYTERHKCEQRLFDLEPSRTLHPESNNLTRRLYLGNGPNDPRYVRIAVNPGWWTVEQFGVALGVVAGTARDKLTGRHNTRRIGTQLDGIWFVETDTAIHLIQSERQAS